ncbi:RNA polymerase II C-terminal domain phosphatase-like 1 [Dichanthelium oligosanthes]|uniref:protein-serine/threonine phosphatase n=1 Tax=Dichanthelium oligosanthes TaxID=888268 RepID=A0A1E5UX13_9POAL|nr:RNA polymerase II C-terminal domain phosphatase-like 1 [Dichanthelium oligosanthes]
MHTVAVGARCLVMESRPPAATDVAPLPLVAMHAACLRDNKTAVVPLGDEELHLVAMTSRRNLTNHAYFWGYKLPFGLYNSCLTMLNLRCLGIVFDLDETLIVANTSRSFEDRIDALQRKQSNETDPQRRNGMLSEIKRYQDDKSILKQYIEGDQVYDDGKVYKAQPEVVPPLSDNQQPMTRPVIRLQDKNIILTRINPLVCLKKSLLNVFHDGSCHPGMALVIDDRLKVWDEKDQSRVHVVPAFTPYYAPQAEANCSIPVLCVARNVACNVRGGFFKLLCEFVLCNLYHSKSSRLFDIEFHGSIDRDFDEGLLPTISNVQYEDEINDISSAPDVGSYLIREDENVAAVNGNRDALLFDGMADAEVERRMKEASGNAQAFHPTVASFVMPVAPPQNFVSSSVTPVAPPLGMMPPPFNQPVVQPVFSDPLQGSPAREEGEVPESELDPDTRRRLLILQHGQDTRDPTPPLPAMPPVQAPVPPVQPHGNWFPAEDGMNPSNVNRGAAGFTVESDSMLYEKKQPPHPSFFHGGGDSPMSSDRFSYQNQRFPSQVGEELSARHVPSSQRNNQLESGRHFAQHAGTSAGILEGIALKCGSKVEYRSTLCDTAELQFSIEHFYAIVYFTESDIVNLLADKYLSSDPNKMTGLKENGFGSNRSFFGYSGNTRDDMFPVSSASEESRFMRMEENNSRKTGGSVAALKELCTVEGYNLVFQARPSPDGSVGKESYAQVEVGGQILGEGVALTWEEAKLQAADEALGTLRSMLGQLGHKRSGSPRSLAPNFNKRFKPDYPRTVHRVPYGTYSRIEGHVP